LSHKNPQARLGTSGLGTTELPMSEIETSTIAKLVGDNEQAILTEWIELQKKSGALQTGRIKEAELSAQSREFLRKFRDALAKGGVNVAAPAYGPPREFLGEVSRSRALQGFSPTETATFVFSLKQPLFSALNRDKTMSPAALAQTIWAITI